MRFHLAYGILPAFLVSLAACATSSVRSVVHDSPSELAEMAEQMEISDIHETNIPALSPPQADNMTDEDLALRRSIRDRHLLDPLLASSEIEVYVFNGSVILNGLVPSEIARRAAERDARRVPGVTDLENQLLVSTKHSITDARLLHRIELALSLNSNLIGNDVDVSVKDGTVILSGQADSARQRELASRIVAGIEGARVIRNEIRVSPAS